MDSGQHDICTKFHDDQFRHLSNITVITATICKSVMLVSLIKGIHHICCWDGFMWRDTHTKFHEDWQGHSRNIKVIPQVML
jgi:hypothetical protein